LDVAAVIISILAFLAGAGATYYAWRQSRAASRLLHIEDARRHDDSAPTFSVEMIRAAADTDSHLADLRVTNRGPTAVTGLTIFTPSRVPANRFVGVVDRSETIVGSIEVARIVQCGEWVDVGVYLDEGRASTGLLQITARDATGGSWSRIYEVELPSQPGADVRRSG